MKGKEAMAGYGWTDCPEETRSLVLDTLGAFRQRLGADLVGFYLHGSLAMGCFNPVLSDIDFLAVVSNRLTLRQKESIVLYLLNARERAPAKGIEMSIVLEEFATHFVYPTPFELHYSNAWDERFRNGQVDLDEPRVDTDLAAHFVVTRQRGVCLYGKPIEETFGEVPREDCIHSLLADAESIYGIPDVDPLYTVLNLPRILAFLETGGVLSKMEAVTWAISRLPNEFEGLLSSAREVYGSRAKTHRVESSNLSRFVDYMKKAIAAAKDSPATG